MCGKPSIDGITHIKCRKKLGLDGIATFWDYSGVIRSAIMKLKYSYAKEMSKDLASLVTDKIKSTEITIAIPKQSVLIPIPLHWHKKNYRGFNQSSEIASLISNALGTKFVNDLLIRKELKKSQTELKGNERKKNVRGVFSFNNNYDINGTNIIIFDDVYTTGSTIKEAGKVLKKNGAGLVWGLTIAK
jgi:ComF family protein